jgi:lysozyme family protein
MEPAPDPIIVQAYSERYAKAFRALHGNEGDLSDDPVDRGGTTKYGISLRFLASEGAFDDDGDGIADFDLDMDGDIDGADIRKLTIGDARYLYLRCFWKPMGCETFPAPIGEMLFDQGVNGGRATAGKLLQRAVNQSLIEALTKLPASNAPAQLKVDGAIGDKTRSALIWVLRHPAFGKDALVENFREAARERYRAIVRRYPAQKKYLRGWLARAERLGREA